MFYGQHGEDRYLKTLFPNDYKGICIEVGAYNGVSLSNTYHFEQNGWRALCIEPIQSAYEQCKTVRQETVRCCIGDKDGPDRDFTVFHLGTNLCAISSLEPDQRLIDSHNHLITNQTIEKVQVRSLTSLLDELDYPTSIDFVSIDTENTELDVLKAIDFGKYNIKVFVIENNYNEPFCEDYLRPLGYKKIHRIAVNDFYIKE